jgi:UDP-N-acetylglucosamine--N-acetylmuramyl-(pentapeptide) pyrophosphoryl-undecaprenol N-acetylglucosamine transferase
MKSKVIFIAGGGTGGHIYPGVAIARAILQKDPDMKIRFVGTSTGLESKIVPREGFELDLIQGGKLNFTGGNFEKIKTLCKIPVGLIQALSLILKHRPRFVLGVGGYASGPFVLVAALCRIPSAVWEPNAHPGMANRWLSRFVDRCYIVFTQAEKWLKNENTFQFGMPVRKEIEEAKKTPRQDAKFHLLSFGGSQGSRAISTVLSDAIVHRGEWTRDLSVVHQIGTVDYAKLKDKYQGCTDIVQPYEFIYDMHNQYAWADLVVARGGASTLTELAAFGVVPIIIPLPAADNHQQRNAESLVNAGAGHMILQENLNEQSLIDAIEELRKNPEKMKRMSENLKIFFQPQAAEKIADDILKQAAR